MSNDIYSYIKENFGIEISDYQFKRDYIQYPLKITKNGYGSETPFEEDLRYLYININLSLQELSKLFNISIYNINRRLSKYGIKKDRKKVYEKSKQTCLEKYGIENTFQLEIIKEKSKQTKLEKYGDKNYRNKEKSKQTCLEKYGVEHYAQTNDFTKKIKQTKLEKYGDENYNNFEKYKETCLKKYGVENTFQNEDIKNKIKQTNLERYGAKNVSQVEIIKEKSKQTCLEKYGVEHYTQTFDYKEKSKQTCLEKYGYKNPVQSDIIKNKIKQTNLKKYGVEISSQSHYSKEILELINNKENLVKYINDNNIINITDLASHLKYISDSTLGKIIKKYQIMNLFDYNGSIEEKEIREYINQHYETENNTRKYLDGKEIDIYIPKLNIGIEFNGNFWHNEYGKEKNYHQEKSLLAESKGIFLYHIFEYEWINKKEQIINQLNSLLGINQNKIYARKCEIKNVLNNEKIKFLETNHLQGNDSSSIKLGLYYNNELVSIMTFCKPRFNKKYEWELSRFCSKNNCNVVGGASKLFRYFINNYNPQSIISYSNRAHTKGKIYETLGFNFDSITEPNYVWCKGYNILSRYQCQKHKLIQEGYKGNSESDIMHNRGYYRIYDCGNKVWVWKNNMNK